MSVDDAKIETMIIDLSKKESEFLDAEIEIRRIIRNLSDIQLIQDPSFPNDDKKKIARPDSRTGVKFTNTDRQKVYDQALKDVTKSLA